MALIQRYDQSLPCSKTIDQLKLTNKKYRKKGSLFSITKRRTDFFVMIAVLLYISVGRTCCGTIICEDNNESCKEICDRHCDYPEEKNVKSNGAGLPGMYFIVPVLKYSFFFRMRDW
jgi:hypothetical protein